VDKECEGDVAIVLTTINSPTEAVRKLCDDLAAEVIVIGDLKTPRDWSYPGADYYSTERQTSMFPSLSELLPYNHYSRKNIGYLIAKSSGCIVDTDDDNIPLDDWFFPDADGSYEAVPADRGFINVYSLFTEQHIWPRGLPLQDILRPGANLGRENLKNRYFRIGVWQGLANGDPDVDAIYRLTINRPCTFNERPPVVLDEGSICPYNSQNTITFRDYYPLLYLPCFVNFRFTDILRGLVGQVILWSQGVRLGFFRATVFQDRNEHDFFRDFVDEEPCYLHSRRVIEIAVSAVRSNESIRDNLVNVYEALDKADIVVGSREFPVMEHWLRELESTNSG
jgi:hypothetical protein